MLSETVLKSKFSGALKRAPDPTPYDASLATLYLDGGTSKIFIFLSGTSTYMVENPWPIPLVDSFVHANKGALGGDLPFIMLQNKTR